MGVGGNTSVLSRQREGSSCQGSRSSYCLFSLSKQGKKRTEAIVFQESHTVPTDEAVWYFWFVGFFLLFSVSMNHAVCDVCSYLLLETVRVRSSYTLPHPVVSVHIISFQKIDS